MDAQQNYQLLGARRIGGGLSLLFKRPFVTCDPKDYMIEVESSASETILRKNCPKSEENNIGREAEYPENALFCTI